MNYLSTNRQHLPMLTSSFVVDSSHLNHEDVLSICKILEAINYLKDEAIVQVTGSLDFSKILLEHFYLDFIEKAALNDLVTFRSYTNIVVDDLIEISITAHKKQGKWNVPIVNGSFVFAVQQGIEIAYSLS